MSITLRQLCASDNYRYGLRVVAGEAGLDNIVQWVHTLEDEEVGDFLHGGELIFTTGIGHRDMDSSKWLLPLVKKLHENEASGVVVNIGPYIKCVDIEVKKYCEETDFPVFTMPWDVHVVDVTRDFCRQMIEMDKKEDNIGNMLQNIIFYPADKDNYIPRLTQKGFSAEERCCLLGIRIENNKKTRMQSGLFVNQYIIRKIRGMCEQVGTFSMNDITYYVLGNCEYKVLMQIVEDLKNLSKEKHGQMEILVCVSSNQENIEKLSLNYKRVSMMLHLSELKEERVLLYDDLGVKKILLSVNDLESLRLYELDVLGKLEDYDEGNHTNLVDFFKIYLDCDGSVQRVAELMYTHRNTVNYQIKKVKNIVGFDIGCLDKKLEIMLAYQIRDILK